MLIVNNRQKAVYESSSFDEFCLRMSESIKENFNISEPQSNFLEEIKLNIYEAESLGFETEETIEQFLYLKWKFPEFKIKPFSKEVLEIITFPDREPETTIDELIYYFETLSLNN